MKFIFKVFFLISLFWIVYGFTIPNNEWYITDKVGVFSETEKADLTSKITEIEKTTSIEIAVLVVSTVDDDINLAAVDVGNQWGVGKSGKNNGLVLLIAVDDRKRSIQVWYGLEWTLPDIVTKQIGETRFPPNFKQGNYYQWVSEMFDDVLWYIKQDPTIVQSYTQTTSQTSIKNLDRQSFEFIFFLLIFVVLGFGRLVTVPTSKGTWRQMKKYGRWIYAGTWLLISLLIAWLFFSIILSVILSYVGLLLGILVALNNKSWWWWGIWFMWWWNWFGWWGSGFGWFGGGSFGGGWSSGSR